MDIRTEIKVAVDGRVMPVHIIIMALSTFMAVISLFSLDASRHLLHITLTECPADSCTELALIRTMMSLLRLPATVTDKANAGDKATNLMVRLKCRCLELAAMLIRCSASASASINKPDKIAHLQQLSTTFPLAGVSSFSRKL